jgi:hypothetical protein
MNRLLKPGAWALTAHINALFDFVALDAFTAAALSNLVRAAGIAPEPSVAQVEERIRNRMGPALAAGSRSIRTQVATRSDNPLNIAEMLRAAGLGLADVAYYRFHAAPPFIEGALPDLKRETRAAEDRLARRWPGHFLASGFLALSRRERDRVTS